MAENPNPTITVREAPAGKIAVETPHTIRPPMTRSWGSVYQYLGSPGDRYGQLVSPRNLSISVKLKMLMDPAIAFCVAFISAKLAKAEYEIKCADAEIRDFFQAMYERFHREFMLQVGLASAIGYLPLIKRYEFSMPRPNDPAAPPVWTSSATPYICTGFEQVWPVGAYPKFGSDRRFEGFHYEQGDVDRLWALWLTIGKVGAFGSYTAPGRVANAYKTWWLGEFNYDQLAVHMQKSVDRVVEVGHPPGKDANGNDLSDVAQVVGDDVRAGATVTIPTQVYTYYDEATGQEKLSNVPMWHIKFLEGADKVGTFIENADHFDSRKAMGMLVPYQLFFQVKQSSLGGPTTADVLGRLATDLLLNDATEADGHLNEYVFPYLVSVNFGPDAPAVRKVTIGLHESDREELFQIVQAALQRIDSPMERVIDVRGMLNRLAIPMRPEREMEMSQERQKPEEQEGEGLQSKADEGQTNGGVSMEQVTPQSSRYDPKKNPSREVLERMLSEPVEPIADEEADVTEDDIERAMRWLDENPEAKKLLEDLETTSGEEES